VQPQFGQRKKSTGARRREKSAAGIQLKKKIAA